MTRNKTTLTLEPAGEHTATVIFMHGLGDTAHGWIDMVAGMFAPALPHVKFILPTARVQPVTINGGMPMPAWYDIESLSADRSREKCEGIEDSAAGVHGMISTEVTAGIPHNRVLLGGFSQGGAMSLFVGLNCKETLAGMLVLSGYMPVPDRIVASPASLATPILMCHGDEDGVVPLAYAQDAHARLKALHATNVRMKVFEGLPHSASDEELADALAFLKTYLPPVSASAAAAPKTA